MASIRTFRQKITNRDYYLSAHAEEEMWDDGLERTDVVENAIMNGAVASRFKDDPRGTRYCIEGPAVDGRTIHVICRLAGALLIITVYAVTKEEE
jgi:Domain of unknown function (DUF4258)